MLESHAGIPALLAYLAHERTTLVARVKQAVDEWRARISERRQLTGLDERMLRDIGLTKLDIWHEANKPFWRP